MQIFGLTSRELQQSSDSLQLCSQVERDLIFWSLVFSLIVMVAHSHGKDGKEVILIHVQLIWTT